jgi:CHAT domain-containing protein
VYHEKVEAVNSARRRWFDVLCRQVLTLAGASSEVARTYVPVRHRPDLGAATLVAWICWLARCTFTTVQIVDHLTACDALSGHGRAEVTALVRRVRLESASKGLPIADWWDPNQLVRTLLRYLAPRVAAEKGMDVAARHLRTVFVGVLEDRIIDALVSRPFDPTPLPSSPAELKADRQAGTQDAVELLANLAELPEIDAYIADVRSCSLLGGGAPARSGGWAYGVNDNIDAWLAESQAAVAVWRALRSMPELLADPTGGDPGGGGPVMIHEAAEIATKAWGRCEAWLADLTEAERRLVAREDEPKLRRRRWLDGHLRIHVIPLLLPDSVPDATERGERLTVPAWVSSDVFDRGARIMHRVAGPLAMWSVVVETDEEEEELGLDHGMHCKIAVGKDGDFTFVDLSITGPTESPDPAWMRFGFLLGEPRNAAGPLLAVLAGVRLDCYRLRYGNVLTHLGGGFIHFPTDSLTVLLDRIDATLARAEADEPGLAPIAFLARFGDQEAPMFATVDNAKSEEILFDLDLFEADADDNTRAVAAARVDLANAELKRVSAEADGAVDASMNWAAEEARRVYRLRRQKVHRSVDRNLADLVVGLVEPGRAFVQFADIEDYLAALVAVDDGGGLRVELVDLGYAAMRQVRAVSDTWLTQTSGYSWNKRADILDAVLLLVGNELIAPVLHVLHDVDVKHTVLCPSRSLEPIPLHAAHVGAGTLSDLFQISYVPSASVASRLATRRLDVQEVGLVVEANGAYGPPDLGLDTLDGSAQEVQALKALTPAAQILRGADARPDDVLAAIACSRVVHIAAHGRSHPDELAGGLWLAGATPGQALLSAARVHAGPPLQETALVVLSACSTAHHPVGGRAVQAWRGLDGAFLARGARAVISSLWQIDDLAALVYGIAFHIYLASGRTVATAHGGATTGLRRGTLDPRAAHLLDQVRPAWRVELEEFDLDRAYWWSAYRPSGICW